LLEVTAWKGAQLAGYDRFGSRDKTVERKSAGNRQYQKSGNRELAGTFHQLTAL
jgi:hypothetical protein